MENIGERIAQKREEAGLSQSELGRRLGLSAQAVQKWESGKSTPRNSKLASIASILGTTVGFLLQAEDGGSEGSAVHGLGEIEPWDETTPLDDDEVEISFLREVELAAGSGRFVIQEDDADTLRFPKRKLRENHVQAGQAKCVTVRGNSMTPVLRDGATVGIDLGKTRLADIVDGDLYAVNHGGQLRVKQLFRLPTGIRLRSFNRDDHPDEDYTFEQMHDSELQIIGHVFWWAMYAR
ncbi:XRE family transcriptional regulator [Pseudomonas sp. NY15354]|uniref:XRE family transcriptional regulator n=1 Tax=Pseudomonas sp. NY15354 TaxID=3400351 RepID=UPI003A8AAE0C